MEREYERARTMSASARWLDCVCLLVMLVAPFALSSVAAAQTPTLVRTTTWTQYDPQANRGLAYDGTYYFLAQIDGSRIDIFDETGLVRSIPKPAGAHYYFPHGVAVDGKQKKIWASDYYGRRIYELDFATGNVLRTISFTAGNSVRLEYDTLTQTLWVSAYGTHRLYNIDMQGTILSSFPVSGYDVNLAIALDANGNLLVAEGEGTSGTPSPFRRYSPTGVLLEEIPGRFTQWDIATNVSDRNSGFLRPSTGSGATYAIEHYTFGHAFASMAIGKVSLAYVRGETGRAQAAAAGVTGNRSVQQLFVCGSFALGAGNNGIDPLSEQAAFGIGDWQASLPAGSFVPHDGGYSFRGEVAGATVRARLKLLPNGRYNYQLWLVRPLPARFDNPLRVKVGIGDDFGDAATTIYGTITKPAATSVAAVE